MITLFSAFFFFERGVFLSKSPSQKQKKKKKKKEEEGVFVEDLLQGSFSLDGNSEGESLFFLLSRSKQSRAYGYFSADCGGKFDLSYAHLYLYLCIYIYIYIYIYSLCCGSLRALFLFFFFVGKPIGRTELSCPSLFL